MTVRDLTPSDVDGLLASLRLMHSENGIFRLSVDRLMETISEALDPKRVVSVGVIGAPDNIEASIGLGLSRVYYSDEWHVGDFWNYVRPDYRKTDHSKKLIEFAKSFSDGMQMKLLTGVVSTDRTDAKIELYRRLVGPLAGAIFIYEPKGQF